MRPILLSLFSVNQRLPSGPAAISSGWLLGGSANSVTAPLGVMRPISLTPTSVNQRLPSGPAVMAPGILWAGRVNSVIVAPTVPAHGHQDAREAGDDLHPVRDRRLLR